MTSKAKAKANKCDVKANSPPYNYFIYGGIDCIPDSNMQGVLSTTLTASDLANPSIKIPTKPTLQDCVSLCNNYTKTPCVGFSFSLTGDSTKKLSDEGTCTLHVDSNMISTCSSKNINNTSKGATSPCNEGSGSCNNGSSFFQLVNNNCVVASSKLPFKQTDIIITKNGAYGDLKNALPKPSKPSKPAKAK